MTCLTPVRNVSKRRVSVDHRLCLSPGRCCLQVVGVGETSPSRSARRIGWYRKGGDALSGGIQWIFKVYTCKDLGSWVSGNINPEHYAETGHPHKLFG